MPRKVAPLLPSTQELLKKLGDRLRLARMRRGLSAKQVAARAGMAPMTLRSLERGGSAVTLGAYSAVMQVLGLEQDLNLIAQADVLGRSLQDARLSRNAERSLSSPSPKKRKRTFNDPDVTVPNTDPSAYLPVSTAIQPLTLDQARQALDELPDKEIRKALTALPASQLREIASTSAQALQSINNAAATINRSFDTMSLAHVRRAIDSLPAHQLHQALKFLSSTQVQALLSTLSSEQLRQATDSHTRAAEQPRKPLEDMRSWLDSSFASSRTLSDLIDTATHQSRDKKR